jgi:hypothetical protein
MRLELSVFQAMDTWIAKNKQLYHLLISPLVDILVQTFMGKFSSELNEFISCGKCKQLVDFVSRPPYDDLLIEGFAMTQISACKAIFSEQACLQLVQAQKRIFKDSFFSLLFTQDFICSYLVPVCGSVPAYEALTVEAYAKAVLEDKPELISGDNYLDSIYKRIEQESNKGWLD